MNVAYTEGTHLDQPVSDVAPTLDYLSLPPTGAYSVPPTTQNFYVHPGTSGYVIELDSGAVVDLSA